MAMNDSPAGVQPAAEEDEDEEDAISVDVGSMISVGDFGANSMSLHHKGPQRDGTNGGFRGGCLL